MKTGRQKAALRAAVVVLICIALFPPGLCENRTWDCPECGKTGNAYDYCGGCGSPAPWITADESALGAKDKELSGDFSYTQYYPANFPYTFAIPEQWITDRDDRDSIFVVSPYLSKDITYIAIDIEEAQNDLSGKKLIQYIKEQVNDKGKDLQNLSRSNTFGIKFLDHHGMGQDYTGITPGGTSVGGRITAISFNKKVYIFSCRYPSEYTQVYLENVYDKVRDSAKGKYEFSYTQYYPAVFPYTFAIPEQWITDRDNRDSIFVISPYSSKDITYIAIDIEEAQNDLSGKELIQYIKEQMNNKGKDLNDFCQSNTFGIKFLDHHGMGQDYTGTTPDGTAVGGRIIAISFDKKVYVLSCRYPSEYTQEFLDNVYDKVRDTIKEK